MPGRKIKFFIRTVELKDCRSLWYWRNHKEARRWSFRPQKIPYAIHCRWFQKTMGDPKKTIYVVCDATGQRVGQTRFERLKNKAIISVTLNPRYYNKGIGNHLIRRTSHKYLKDFPNIKKIVAEINQNHIASHKAFYKANYSLDKKTVKLGKKIFILTYQRKPANA